MPAKRQKLSDENSNPDMSPDENGTFEDPDLELHADFGSLREWDLRLGSHDWLLFNIPRTWPRKLAHLWSTGFRGSGGRWTRGWYLCREPVCRGRQKIKSSKLAAGCMPRDSSS
ncbi:uncharacterized protein LOC134349500 isoform X1 [Mobula hypostoma]|uniref:uncharacterized protein LOC134349500 isoform X1 n=1 Tax=Mobula hypostoma TaxID=723540 RepID=UPI002FC379A4